MYSQLPQNVEMKSSYLVREEEKSVTTNREYCQGTGELARSKSQNEW